MKNKTKNNMNYARVGRTWSKEKWSKENQLPLNFIIGITDETSELNSE